MGDEIHACGEWLSPTEEEHERRLYFVECLRRKLAHVYPWCELVTFGSLLTRLYLPDGEIDVALIWLYGKPVQGRHNPFEKTSTLLADIWPVFKWHYFFGDVGQIPEKMTQPQAKLTRNQREFERQIRRSTDSGEKVAQWINGQMLEKPYLRPFILVVKAWATRTELSSLWNGGVGCYCLIVMIVSFFQLRRRVGERASDLEPNIGRLLVSFFAYYGNVSPDARSFDYTLGISVRNDGLLFDPVMRGWAARDVAGLYVEDPWDTSNNLGACVVDLDRIQQAFHVAYELLLEAVCQRKSGHHKGSMLNVILGYDTEYVDRRVALSTDYPLVQLRGIFGPLKSDEEESSNRV